MAAKKKPKIRKRSTPTISINPDPPTAGKSATITYTGAVGTVLNLDWNPSGGTPTSVTIGANGTATLTIPTNATSLVIVDSSGKAAPLSTPIG